MKLGIIGLPQSGKAAIFEALTQHSESATHKGENRLGTVNVPDNRLDILRDMYEPQKQIYAQISYLLPGMQGQKKESSQSELNQIRDCDALIHVIRNFKTYGGQNQNPYQDFIKLNQELILTDLAVVESRLERLNLEKKQCRTVDEKEISLLTECLKHLEDETALRKFPELASADILKGFAFISGKPMLVLFNNDDEDNSIPDINGLSSNEYCIAVRGRLEQEIIQLPDEEKDNFLAEFNIAESALDRVIRKSYELFIFRHCGVLLCM